MGGRDFRRWSVERSTCSLIVFGSSENEVPSRGLREILRPGRRGEEKERDVRGVGRNLSSDGKAGENDIPASYQVLLKTAIMDAVTESLTGQRLLYSRIFLFHVKQLSPNTSTDEGSLAGLRYQRIQCEIAHWERCRGARCR